jgi:hypothetical protein
VATVGVRLRASARGGARCGGGLNDLLPAKADFGLVDPLVKKLAGCAELSASGGLAGTLDLGAETCTESRADCVQAYMEESAKIDLAARAMCIYEFSWEKEFAHGKQILYTVPVKR